MMARRNKTTSTASENKIIVQIIGLQRLQQCLKIPRLHHSFYIESFDKVLRRYTLQYKKEGLVRMAHAIFKSFEAVVVHEFS